MFFVGLVLVSFLAFQYIDDGYTLSSIGEGSYRAITGVMLMIFGFMTFTFTLLLHASSIRWSDRQRP